EDELKNMTILDLYCGIGTIGLFMADTAKYVIGVEIVKEAVNNARSNAKLNSIVNCEFIHADVNDAILQIEYDILIADPPRKGLDDSVIQSIRDKKPETIIYISCNSSTLSRDLGMLSDLYSLKAIEAVDMFSHTGHVETVVLMSRNI
ncbi:MAG: methyltransferase domain-containing protein, partial [Synergistaceae bacterium]|nr:methyltransferase domain-containing protein [Synergistaceae bacterium]